MGDLNCIRCGEAGGVRLDVSDGDTLACTHCDAEYSAGEVRAVVDAWARLLAWIDLHPANRPEPAAARD